MDHTKIDWADMSWNPVTGCRHGCEYCYARRIAGRYGGYVSGGQKITFNPYEGQPELNEPMTTIRKDGSFAAAPYPFGFEPTFHRYRLGEPARKQRPRNIFVCSMADLFGRWVPMRWIIEVLDACQAAPQHNYLFLTKNPQRYVELDEMALLPRNQNFWYGTTATEAGQPYFYSDFHNTFVSVEPITGPVFPDGRLRVDWVIVGAETGNRADKVAPEPAWIHNLLDACQLEEVPLFMKGNLAPYWAGELVQELPTGLRGDI